MITLIVGPKGSGRSTLARALAKETKGVLVDDSAADMKVGQLRDVLSGSLDVVIVTHSPVDSSIFLLIEHAKKKIDRTIHIIPAAVAPADAAPASTGG